MTRISSLAFALLILTAFGLQSASAQFRIPDIPGIKKPKADPPRSAGGQSEAAAAPTADTSVASPDQPTIAKDSIQVKAFTNSSYRKDLSVWSWVPKVTFRVNGPLASGKLGSDRVIVLVQILGDQDGQWNRAAWQTEAFYGNPLHGFTATGAQ